MTNIKLSDALKNTIYNDAFKQFPRECCGFVIGYIQNSTLVCVDVKKANNIASNPYNYFEIEPQEIINLQKTYRNNKLSVLGHYHSHPNSLLGSRPSKKDVDSIYDNNLCWIIIGINKEEIECSAYIPILNTKNGYEFKKINII
jgi:proteasome lid subunit RPN8/RPN11